MNVLVLGDSRIKWNEFREKMNHEISKIQYNEVISTKDLTVISAGKIVEAWCRKNEVDYKKESPDFDKVIIFNSGHPSLNKKVDEYRKSGIEPIVVDIEIA